MVVYSSAFAGLLGVQNTTHFVKVLGPFQHGLEILGRCGGVLMRLHDSYDEIWKSCLYCLIGSDIYVLFNGKWKVCKGSIRSVM